MNDNVNVNANNPFGLLHHACSLAKELELLIPNSTAGYNNNNNNYLEILSQKCEEIIEVFTLAKDHLNSLHQREMTTAVFGGMEVEAAGKAGKEIIVEVGVGEGAVEGGGSGSGSSTSTLQRSNKRSSRNEEEGDRRDRVRLAAPQIGNLEMPPEDGFTWRKYGQKEILNSKYPRSYYRCTHQKLYNCPAKKQVQRLDHDPFTFDILYRGHHTCHISSTAPTAPLPRRSSFPPVVQNVFFSQQPTTTTTTTPLDSLAHQWLTMDLPGPPSNDQAAAPPTLFPSTTIASDLLHHHSNYLLDLADAMFNSGSSSNSNNMDVIFPTIDDPGRSQQE